MSIDDEIGFRIEPRRILHSGSQGNVFLCRRVPVDPESGICSPRRSSRRESSKQQSRSEQQVIVTEVPLDDRFLWAFPWDAISTQLTAIVSISHANAVKLLQVVTHNGVSRMANTDPKTTAPSFSWTPALCAIEEAVSGCTLLESLRCVGASPLSVQQISTITHDILRVLSFLHSKCRYVHGNITSQNVMLDKRTGLCKLSGFASIFAIESPTEGCTTSRRGYWCAPEVERSGLLDHRTLEVISHSYPADMWSLGVLVLEMSGGISFQEDGSATFLRPVDYIDSAAKTSGVVDQQASAVPSSCSPSTELRNPLVQGAAKVLINSFILACLQEDPIKRKTAAELLEHPFIKNYNFDSKTRDLERSRAICGIIETVERCRAARNSTRGSDVILNMSIPNLLLATPPVEVGSDMMAKDWAFPTSGRLPVEPFKWTIPTSRQSHISASLVTGTVTDSSEVGQHGISTSTPQEGEKPQHSASFIRTFIRPATMDVQRTMQVAWRKRSATSFRHGVSSTSDSLNFAASHVGGNAPAHISSERLNALLNDLVSQVEDAASKVPSFPRVFCEALVTAAMEDTESVAACFNSLVQALPPTETGMNKPTTAISIDPSLLVDDVRQVPRSKEEWQRVAPMPCSGQVGNNATSYLYNKWLRQTQQKHGDD